MDLNALREFSAIASEGSFAAAARKLGTPKSTVSKRIQDLEAALGVRLIERTTRRLKLTEEGAFVLARADRILADAEEIRCALGRRQDTISGHLRIAAPALFGESFIGQIVAACRQLHPGMTLEIVLTDSQPDLVEEGFDGAVRMGASQDDRYVSRPLAQSWRVCAAAPELVPAPLAGPEDLAGLPVLLHGVGLIQTWHFEREGRSGSVRLVGGAALTSYRALRAAALGGAGAALLPLFLIEEDLAAGRLVPALDGWYPPVDTVHFVYPDAQALTARLRVFMQALDRAFPKGTLHDSVLSQPRES